MALIKWDDIEIDTDTLTVDDMPTQTFREIFELCGVEIAVSLLQNMTGNIIQVPARGLSNIVVNTVIREFDKSAPTSVHIREMARRFKCSEMHIRNILLENKKNVPAIRQGSLGLRDEKGKLL